jgi:hypothetical protein
MERFREKKNRRSYYSCIFQLSGGAIELARAVNVASDFGNLDCIPAQGNHYYSELTYLFTVSKPSLCRTRLRVRLNNLFFDWA